MKKELAGIALFSLVLGMIIPAHAEANSLELEKSFYTNAERLKFIGTQDGKETVYVIIHNSAGKYKGMLSDPTPDQGKFAVLPQSVTSIFASPGIYNATAFTNDQGKEKGITIKIEYDGEKIFEVPDFVLTLKTIQDVTIDEEKTVSFTVGITDSSVDGVVYSLEKGPPTGATINSETGKFVWTPSSSHGNSPGAQYVFDIVATKGSQVDRESITITVNDPVSVPPPKVEPKKSEPKVEPKKPEPEPKEPEPKEIVIPAPFVDKSKDPQSYVDRYNNEMTYKDWFDKAYPEYDSIYHAVGLEEPLDVPAPFVDKSKDPQSYVDRYNNEMTYKDWFDKSYPEYDSIYHAVGLEEPLDVPAPFVDKSKDPQSYVDRYNNEMTYKDWFDKAYPDMTIYEAVGLEEPTEEEPEFGECGEGTELVEDTCVIVNNSKGGGCLIATAAYGTELAPQVQFLREVRDNTVMGTSSGMAFMAGFNQVYYSFSPTIADWERENPMFQEAVRAFITPMVSSLSIMTLTDGSSEIEVLGLGISVIALNLGMYIAAPALIAFKARKLLKN